MVIYLPTQALDETPLLDELTPREIVQELLDRLLRALVRLREAVEGIEWPGFAVQQDNPRARYPVGALPDDQVAHDIEGAPGIFSFVAVYPDVRQPAQ